VREERRGEESNGGGSRMDYHLDEQVADVGQREVVDVFIAVAVRQTGP
jgi:hypothetical protein